MPNIFRCHQVFYEIFLCEYFWCEGKRNAGKLLFQMEDLKPSSACNRYQTGKWTEVFRQLSKWNLIGVCIRLSCTKEFMEVHLKPISKLLFLFDRETPVLDPLCEEILFQKSIVRKNCHTRRELQAILLKSLKELYCTCLLEIPGMFFSQVQKPYKKEKNIFQFS